MLLQAKEDQRLLVSPEAKRKTWHRFSPRAFRESMSLLTPCFLTSSLQNCERVCFCCFKSLSLWNVDTAAPGNCYSHVLAVASMSRSWRSQWSRSLGSPGKHAAHHCLSIRQGCSVYQGMWQKSETEEWGSLYFLPPV